MNGKAGAPRTTKGQCAQPEDRRTTHHITGGTL